MTKSQQKTLGWILIGLSAAIAAVGFMILPDVLIVQIGLDGKASNTLPKLPGLLIPLAITTISSIRYMQSETSDRIKNLVIALIGLGIGIFSMVINLRP